MHTSVQLVTYLIQYMNCASQHSPSMRLQMAVRAILIFWNEPSIWTLELANMILVLVTFSIVNFVLPPDPAILPIALERWSPFSDLTAKEEEINW